MRGKLWSIISACSLTLGILAAALWARGYWIADVAIWNPRPTLSIRLDSSHGLFRFDVRTIDALAAASYPMQRYRPAFSIVMQPLQPVPFTGGDESVFGFDFTNQISGPYHFRAFALPSWFVVVGFMVVPGTLYIRRRRANRAKAGEQQSTPTLEGGAPDWTASSDEIECPMCDYNLRGLTEPRCPECGYAFAWTDLTDPTRRRHPYLFELQNRRRVRAYFKTVTRDFEPNRFWKSVHAIQPVRGFLLAVYACIGILITLLPTLALPWIELPGRFGAWNRATAPWYENVEYFLYHQQRLIAYFSIVMAIYPALTALSLLVFQQSMRRAHVRSGHAMRCAIYSSDAIFWYGLWQIGMILLASMFWQIAAVQNIAPALLIGIVGTIVLTTLRLRSAYAYYMKFPHALAIALLTQTIVLLLIFTATTGTFVKLFLS